MTPWRAIITVLGLLSAANGSLACDDPLLSTNTRLAVLKARYQEIKAAAQSCPGADRSSARAGHACGAGMLFSSKEACFLYPNLRSQYEIACLSPLISNYDSLLKVKTRVTTVREGKTVSICIQMVGTGTHSTLLICIPGVMSDSSVFRFLVGALANEYDFWLIDPPGCGESEAPNPKHLGPGGYSPAAMADRELQAIETSLVRCPKDVRVLIMAHSLGGLVTLRAFGEPQLRHRYRNVLSRIEGLVLLAPGDVFMSQVSPALASRAELSGLTIGIGNGLGVVREAVAEFLVQSFYASHCVPREEVDHAVEVLSNSGKREAFKAMLREALAFDLKAQQPNFFEMMVQAR